jgi:ribosomal protein S18 acetylase RimI-like enzyme/uncharacterized protein YciI
MKQFLYRIQPARSEMLTSGPTAFEASAIADHFSYLERLTGEGVVLLAGRTSNSDERTFGIVVFAAVSDDEAGEVVRMDPAVARGVMIAQLFPFSVALLSHDWSGEKATEPDPPKEPTPLARSASTSDTAEHVLEIRAFHSDDRDSVVALWERCGLLRAANDPFKDIARKQKVGGDLFLVGLSGGEIVAAVMAGYDGHRGWLNYLAVSPSHRKMGYGRQMVRAAECRLLAEGCPKVNLHVRDTNPEAVRFYSAIGYTQDSVLCFGKRIEHDNSGVKAKGMGAGPINCGLNETLHPFEGRGSGAHSWS